MGERTTLTVEGTPVVRIMQIHREVVGEAEHDTSQGVPCSTLLYDTHLPRTQTFGRDPLRIQGIARTAVDDRIAVTGEIGGVATMLHHIRLDDVEGDAPLGVHLHITDGTIEQRRLRGNSTTADAHIEYGVATHGPQMLGGDIHHHPTFVLGRMLDLPTTTLHIDGEFPTLFLIGSLQESSLQSLVHIVLRL